MFGLPRLDSEEAESRVNANHLGALVSCQTSRDVHACPHRRTACVDLFGFSQYSLCINLFTMSQPHEWLLKRLNRLDVMQPDLDRKLLKICAGIGERSRTVSENYGNIYDGV